MVDVDGWRMKRKASMAGLNSRTASSEVALKEGVLGLVTRRNACNLSVRGNCRPNLGSYDEEDKATAFQGWDRTSICKYRRNE